MDNTNNRQIRINPVTRIEGHARITITLDEKGKAEKAVFHVNEFRGFEKFCEGRLYTEMPTITPRICGICPISHTLASVKACEMIQGIQPARTGDLLRRLLQLGQHVSSHALSFFYLSAPDFLLGYDAEPATRNIIGVAQRYPDIARKGIRLRQFGQEISERITGKKIHSMGIAPGGTTFPLTEGNRKALMDWIPEVKDTAMKGIEIIRRFMDGNPEMVNSFATAPTGYLGTVGPEGQHELYDGRLRFMDRDGKLLQDQLDPARYLDIIAERSVDWSYLTSPYYKPLGIEEGTYRVGPLARLNVASRMKTPMAQKEFLDYRSVAGGKPVHGTFYFHWARLIETLTAIEEAEELLGMEAITSTHTQQHGQWNYAEGIGSGEAPRGTLFHHYTTDPTGKLLKVNLLIATGQNNAAMNGSITEVARQYITGPDVKEGMLNRVESAIRCYDPCLSCSTHAMGQMPMVIDITNAQGQLIRSMRRF
jgi:NAD-reducing hydrogenase large subunit